MIDFVCEILPGVFSACLAEYLMEKKLPPRRFLGMTALNIVLTNMFCAVFFFAVLNTDIYQKGFTARGAFKYMAISLAAGAVLGAAESYAVKRFRLTWKEAKEE